MIKDQRLIDVNAAVDRYYAEWEHHCLTLGQGDKQWLQQCLDEAPTVEAVEVVHGRWEKVKGFAGFFTWEVQCSECKVPQDSKSNFCPNCGAIMDGGKHD